MAAFSFPVRVYWEDTDAGGIVYHANYLKFMERARSEWLRELGVNQRTLVDSDEAALFVVADMQIRFRRAAHLDDALVVKTTVDVVRSASVTFKQEVFRDDVLLCDATVRVGVIDPVTRRPKAMSETLKARFE